MLVAQSGKCLVCASSSVENPQQWPDPAPDSGLGICVSLQLAPRVGLFDHPANPWALFKRYLGAFHTAGKRGLDGGLEKSRLADSRAVDRLHGHASLGGDPRNGGTGVAALQEDAAGGLDDVGPGLGSLGAPTGRVIPPLGSCRPTH